MIQANGKINADALPMLTEVADASARDIPTLTEIHTPEHRAPDVASAPAPDIPVQAAMDAPASEPLSEAACLYLAAQIAPQVDALLQAAVRDIQSRLPEIIRAAMDNDTR